ncbi:hypothetical protein E2C01_069645 [Portunus trituberculatus]|uniref:Uncharacterized protein n=1 Tax=Portunus trituberculatus TaxID=210409 RepID=A0A5B7HS38_PORTR|nr:hypothetical protein [Portunus trituberculatus]
MSVHTWSCTPGLQSGFIKSKRRVDAMCQPQRQLPSDSGWEWTCATTADTAASSPAPIWLASVVRSSLAGL